MRRAGSALMLVLVGVAVLTAGSAQGAPGTLDQSFGTGGKVATSFGSSYDAAYAVAIQRNGKIVAAGVSGFGVFALARYKPNGTLDASFGRGGKVKTPFSQKAAATSVALQEDGKIVAAGGGGGDFVLARYKPNGTLDPAFGSGGRVTTEIEPDNYAEALALAIQPDGKIIAAGGTSPNGGVDYVFALARYNPNGTLDPSFGSGGTTTTTIGSEHASIVWGVVVQPDGDVVAAGYDFTYNGEDQPTTLGHFELARYQPNGTLDPSFGTGGRVTTQIGSGDAAFDVALQSDGKIVAAGTSQATSTAPLKFALIRYKLDGSLDPDFGSGGKVTTAFAEDAYARGVAIEPDGKIVAVGVSAKSPHGYAFALARYRLDGSLDPAFGRAGKLRTVFGLANAVALQPDGKIVAVGARYDPIGQRAGFGLARYLVGPSPCRVPNVKGKLLDAARQALIHSYCRPVTARRAFSAKVAAGLVISQRPTAGAVRPEGTRVRLVVSKGKKQR